jgi:hypothetical protein
MRRNRVIKLKISARSIVRAQPGCGKTSVLIKRIQALLQDRDLQSPTSIIVFSFSNAATQEIRCRLKSLDHIQDSFLKQITTIDSYVSMLLGSKRFPIEKDDISRYSYDARIDLMNSLIEGGFGVQFKKHISKFQHVLMDEFQDTVGRRLRFINSLIRALNPEAGFTFFGDEAQGIYTPDANDPHANEKMYSNSQVRNYGKQDLSRNFRVKDPKLRNFVTNCHGFFENNQNPFNSMLTLFKKEDYPSSSLESLKAENLKLEGASTAFLASTNAEAIFIRDHLCGHGLQPIHLQALSGDVIAQPYPSFPSWISQLPHFINWRVKQPKLTKEVLHQCFSDMDMLESLDEAIMQLSAFETEFSEDGLDFQVFLTLIAAKGFTFQSTFVSGLFVSTIHNVKGKQFDHIKLSFPKNRNAKSANVLFVGISRPAQSIERIEIPANISFEKKEVYFKNHQTQRWLKKVQNQRRGFQVGFAADIDPVSFVSKMWHENVEEAQEFLFQSKSQIIGREVSLDLNPDGITYIIHLILEGQRRLIGAMSQTFFEILKANKIPIQKSYEGLRVVNVITILQDWNRSKYDYHEISLVSVPEQIRNTGVWLGVNISGFIRINSELE